MEDYVRETLQRAREVGNPRAIALCLSALGAVLQLQGQWRESVSALTESVNLCRTFNGEFGDVIGEQRLGQIESAVGLFDQAKSRLERALKLAMRSSSPMVKAHSLGRVYSALALSRFEAGDLTEATRYLARGFATQKVVGDCAGCDVTLYPAAVPIYIAHGDLRMADEVCGKAEATAGAFRSHAWFGTSRYLSGLLAAAHEEWDLACFRFGEAMAIFEDLKQPYDLARVQQELAIARSRSGDTSGPAPSELLDAACKTYLDLGAPYRAEVARGLMAGLPGARP